MGLGSWGVRGEGAAKSVERPGCGSLALWVGRTRRPGAHVKPENQSLAEVRSETCKRAGEARQSVSISITKYKWRPQGESKRVPEAGRAVEQVGTQARCAQAQAHHTPEWQRRAPPRLGCWWRAEWREQIERRNKWVNVRARRYRRARAI